MALFPINSVDYAHAIAIETARMAYPGGMSFPTTTVVTEGTKGVLETYFGERFDIFELWQNSKMTRLDYDEWHIQHVRAISALLKKKEKIAPGRRSEPVAAKFLNTFMHQLMKYKRFHSLWPNLHLPLDSRIFRELKKNRGSKALSGILKYLETSPYNLSYSKHLKIQLALLDYILEINRQNKNDPLITSRIELNVMWL